MEQLLGRKEVEIALLQNKRRPQLAATVVLLTAVGNLVTIKCLADAVAIEGVCRCPPA